MVPLVQKELDVFRETVWNTHRIRAQKDTNLPVGIPNHIHNFPEQYGLEQCGRYMILYCPEGILLYLNPFSSPLSMFNVIVYSFVKTSKWKIR